MVVFFKTNVTTHAVPDAVPGDAAVNTSCPAFVQAPVVPNRSDVEDTVKLASSAVCDPVSPVIVTVDPVGRSKVAVNETVNVLVAPDPGVLCWIDFRLNVGTSTAGPGRFTALSIVKFRAAVIVRRSTRVSTSL